MRLFAAVHPSLRALEHLETAVDSVRGPGRPGLRWTPPEGRHVTLAFYGEVGEGFLEDLAQALDDVGGAHPCFPAALRGAGVFEGRTLWVGCSGDGWLPLMTAAGRVGAEVLGRAPDGRSRPHLTVARANGRLRAERGRRGRRADRAPSRVGRRGPAVGRRGPAGDAEPAALAHALALYTGPTWAVEEVALVRSRPGAGPGGGPLYDVVHRSPLRPVAG